MALEGGLGHVNVGRAHVNVDDGVNVGGVHVEMQIHQRGRRLTLTWARVNVDRRTTLTWACVNAGEAHAGTCGRQIAAGGTLHGCV